MKITKEDKICPDQRLELFNYGIEVIVHAAVVGNKMRKHRVPPSKVQRELEHLSDVFENLSLEAMAELNLGDVVRPFEGVADLVRKHIADAIAQIKAGRSARDEVRKELGRDAAAIWAHHHGDVGSEKFEEFLSHLIEEIENDWREVDFDAKKLAREVRRDCKDPRIGVRPWRLFETDFDGASDE